MTTQHPPILICYDGSPGAASRSTRALSQAGTLIPAGTDVHPGEPEDYASPMMRALHIGGHGRSAPTLMERPVSSFFGAGLTGR